MVPPPPPPPQQQQQHEQQQQQPDPHAPDESADPDSIAVVDDENGGQNTTAEEGPDGVSASTNSDYASSDRDDSDNDWDGWSDDEEVMETILEAHLRELLQASERLSAWRARAFVRQCAARLVPLRMLDVAVLAAACVSLPPRARARLAALRLAAPAALARTVLVSKLLNAVLVAAILASIALLCVETNPALSATALRALFALEAACNAVFLLEIAVQRVIIQTPLVSVLVDGALVAREYGSRLVYIVYTLSFTDKKAERIRTRLDWSTEPAHPPLDPKYTNIRTLCAPENTHKDQIQYIDSDRVRWAWLCLDILTTVPFFIEAAVYSLDAGFDAMLVRLHAWNGTPPAVRFFRLCRVLRLLKIAQKSGVVRAIAKAFVRSTEGVHMLFALVPLVVVFFAFILFYAEISRSTVADGVWIAPDGSVLKFQSVFDCFWLVIVTLTTVGYGDLVPATSAGKFIMSLVMVLSLFIVAFPLCMITLEFTHFARRFSEQKAEHSLAVQHLRARLMKKTEETVQDDTARIQDSTLTVHGDILDQPSSDSDKESPRLVSFVLSNYSSSSSSASSNSSIKSINSRAENNAPSSSSSGLSAEQCESPVAMDAPTKPKRVFFPPETTPDAAAARPPPRRAQTAPNPHTASIASRGSASTRAHHRHSHVRVTDLHIGYAEDSREDVVTLRLQCRDEASFRRLVKGLSEF